MPSINVKKKGNRFEVYCANFFKMCGFPLAERNLTECREGQGIDLVDTGSFDVQCKSKKQYVSVNTINEVPIVKGRHRILITKANRKEVMVVMGIETFGSMLRNWKED